MSVENVRQYFAKLGMSDRVIEFSQSSATVALAAQALGCEPAHIAKTMSFLLGGKAILIVCAGDTKIDNQKYKAAFHEKAKMIPWDDVESFTGHAPGGVCPFEIKQDVTVYLDVSLRRFETVYPAAGSSNSAVKLSVPELEKYSKCASWIDVCKIAE